jgi:hypothetical protein
MLGTPTPDRTLVQIQIPLHLPVCCSRSERSPLKYISIRFFGLDTTFDNSSVHNSMEHLSSLYYLGQEISQPS